MAGVTTKSFDAPGETRTADQTQVDVVDLGGAKAARLTAQPGWGWSERIKPVGGDSCQVLHVGTVVAGQLHRARPWTGSRYLGANPEPLSSSGPRRLPRRHHRRCPVVDASRSRDHLRLGLFDDGFGVGQDPLDVVGSRIRLVLDGRACERRGDERPVDDRELEVRAVLRALPRLLGCEAERAHPGDLTVLVGTALEMAGQFSLTGTLELLHSALRRRPRFALGEGFPSRAGPRLR